MFAVWDGLLAVEDGKRIDTVWDKLLDSDGRFIVFVAEGLATADGMPDCGSLITKVGEICFSHKSCKSINNKGIVSNNNMNIFYIS